MSSNNAPAREMTFSQAIREALEQEMARDPAVFVLGQGVDDVKGFYGSTLDLHKRFGKERCFDTPLSEDAITGICIGAALAGMRPVNTHQRMDFMLLCLNQLVNVAAKSRYMYAGAASIPMVVRGVVGRSWGQGPQHTQSFHSYFMHVPGFKIFAPATPHAAKGCMISAIRDDNPVLIMENRMLHGTRGEVPESPYGIPFGQANVMTSGGDLTLVAISHMVLESLQAAQRLGREKGIAVEVIDPVSLAPLDMETIARSVEKTGRLLVVDNGWINCGASAEIVAQMAERWRGDRGVRVRRLGFAPVPCPTTKPLENLFYPNAATIAAAAYALITGRDGEWVPDPTPSSEVEGFRGPF
ncbi:MAG: alpha-ketoacid dehydrogenase subunit beta [Magnetococcales bacterium]|nr:alpha-ketoacid dehydrogenase subunit beta [Magnetococcales bacterium]